MVSHAIRPEVGAVGARLWYPDGRLQHAGVVLGLHGLASHAFPTVSSPTEVADESDFRVVAKLFRRDSCMHGAAKSDL